jgi:hypothetical protein
MPHMRMVPMRRLPMGNRMRPRPRSLSHWALGQDDSDFLDTDYLSSAPEDTGSFETDVMAPPSDTTFDYTEANDISPVIPGVSTAGTPTFASSVLPVSPVAPILPTTGSSTSSASTAVPSLQEAASAASALTSLVGQLTSVGTARATPCTTPTGAAGTVSGSTCIATPTSGIAAALTASTLISGVPNWLVGAGGLLAVVAIVGLAGKR